MDTLTIIARPEYNGTEVVCVAVFFDGSRPELSPAALLQGYFLVISLDKSESERFCVRGHSDSIKHRSRSTEYYSID